MIIPVLKFCHRSTIIFFEIVGLLLFMVAAVMGFTFWKLSKGPVDVTFAADTIKHLIVTKEHTTDIQFSSIVAEWPEFSGPISIGLSGVRLTENNKPVMNIPQLGIRLAKAPLLIGLLKPEAIIAKNATVKLYRAKNGGVHLLLNDAQTPSEAVISKTAPSFKDIGEALFKGGNLPDYHEIEPLSQMERFSINAAHVVIIDEETGRGWNIPQMDFDLLREDDSFTMTATYQEGSTLSSNFLFKLERDNDDDTIRFHSDIDRINASILGQLFLPVQPAHGPKFIVRGKVDGRMDSHWNVQTLEGDITSEQGDLNLDGLIDAPLKFSDLSANISYDRSTNKIILHDTHIAINNRNINLSGEKVADSNSSVFGLRVQIPELTFDEIHNLWPASQKNTITADWLVNRLGKAAIRNLEIVIPIDINHPDNVDPTKLQLAFDYDGLTADYSAPLTAVTESKGHAALKDDVLTITVDSGKMGDMSIQKGRVEITHLTHPTIIGDVTIDADLNANIGSVLSYISLEPISLGEKIGIDPTKVKGTSTLTVKVTFPALKDLPAEDVKVVANAKLNDVFLPSIVRGMDLTGGPYDLAVSAGSVTISGKGALGNQPIDLSYTEYINLADAPFKSAVKASIQADKKLREKFGVHLDQFVDGVVPVKIAYQQNKNNDEEIGIDADLTPAVVTFSPFKYTKPVGQGGQATCNVFIQKGEVQTIKDLNITIAKSGQAKGNLAFGKVGNDHDVKSGQFSNITLAGDNNFALDFIQTYPNVFDINIKGKKLDGRPFLHGGSSTTENTKNNTAVNVNAVVDQIRSGPKDDQFLNKPILSLKTNASGDVVYLDLRGMFKDGNLAASIKPDATGRMRMNLSSDNAGGALYVLDLYDQMIGGTMDIRAMQIKGGGVNDMIGRGQISNFTVVRAPVLAKLINLFSLSGLTELLQNKGIGFEDLRTDFEWKSTKDGRVIFLKDGRTSGASIALTFGGNVYQDKGSMSISGTFVPVSGINGLFGKIPLIGNILIGGKNGGIIAATYTMSGATDNPSVFINPLSVLTPGFLRSFLFENNTSVFDETDLDQEQGSSKKPIKKGYNN